MAESARKAPLPVLLGPVSREIGKGLVREVVLPGEGQGLAQGLGQAVAGDRMEQPGARARPRAMAAARPPEALPVSPGDDRQDAALLVEHGLDHPPLRTGIGRDAQGQRGLVDGRAVGIVGVLDEDLVGASGRQ
jgi:hypothetical protein